MNICLFSESEINSPLPLCDERAKHIVKVLRKKEGDTFKAGVINGKVGTAKITKIDDGKIEFEFRAEMDGLPLNPLVMIIGFPRPIQLKRLLRDVAALGVREVHLTGTELGEKSYMQSNLAEHDAAYALLVEGTVQAGTTSVPELFLHRMLGECLKFVVERKNTLWISNLKQIENPDCPQFSGCEPVLLALDNVQPVCSLLDAVREKKGCGFVAAIGSERGWTDNERKLLEDAGFIRCGMGKRIMRTETAATVSASVILAESGLLC